jgi:alkylated DNA repair dioxygenase AlkB
MQSDLFSPDPPAPEGLIYREALITPAEETRLIAAFGALPFAPFRFHGHEGLRRVVAFGSRYDYARARVAPAEPIPDWLTPLRARAARLAGIDGVDLAQALVTEYRPGAPIGWHRDRPHYGVIVGVSFGPACVLRLRRARPAGGWDRHARPLAPRSAYVLDGEARWVWEHSIAPAAALRYSVTFRTPRG